MSMMLTAALLAIAIIYAVWLIEDLDTHSFTRQAGIK